MSNLKIFNQKITDARTQDYLTTVLGEKRASFVSNLTALVASNKALQECEPMTLMYAAMQATAIDLPLDNNLGFAYVIPYKNYKTGVIEAEFQMGYKGFVQLAIRTNLFRTINVTEVREGEVSDLDLVSGTMKFTALPHRDTLPVCGYVAYFALTNGFEKLLYMTAEQVEAHAKRYSQSYGSQYENTRKSSKWTTDFAAMAKKTVLKLLLSRWAPLSVEMRQAIRADQSVLHSANTYDYVDRAEEAVGEECKGIADDVREKAEKAMRRADDAAKAQVKPQVQTQAAPNEANNANNAASQQAVWPDVQPQVDEFQAATEDMTF